MASKKLKSQQQQKPAEKSAVDKFISRTSKVAEQNETETKKPSFLHR